MSRHTDSRRTGFDDALAAFLDYLSAYGGCSPHTVKAYAREVRAFRGHLSKRTNSRCNLTPSGVRLRPDPQRLTHHLLMRFAPVTDRVQAARPASHRTHC